MGGGEQMTGRQARASRREAKKKKGQRRVQDTGF